jgi:hypothetical protein
MLGNQCGCAVSLCLVRCALLNQELSTGEAYKPRTRAAFCLTARFGFLFVSIGVISGQFGFAGARFLVATSSELIAFARGGPLVFIETDRLCPRRLQGRSMGRAFVVLGRPFLIDNRQTCGLDGHECIWPPHRRSNIR